MFHATNSKGGPSCVGRHAATKSSSEGAGITAIAVVIGAALIAAKIGPIVARILHVVVEVLTIVVLTAASALACLLVTCLVIRVHRALAEPPPSAPRQIIPAAGSAPPPGCTRQQTTT